MTQTSIQVNEAMARQIEALRERGFGPRFTDIVRTAVDRMYQQEVVKMEQRDSMYDQPNALQRAAQERGQWVASDARGNPRNNKEHWFDTRDEARAHVRTHYWRQVVYGPSGEFEMWDGHKWG
jgi:Arc/MetJ-type ribon-helix-helix transcriptional regulator